jgi:RNA polymerase sigma factor for flagellar operon FliA
VENKERTVKIMNIHSFFFLCNLLDTLNTFVSEASMGEAMNSQTESMTKPSNRVRDQLIVTHLSYAKKIAHKIIAQLPSHLDKDDLISAAVIGLIMAAERFDPSRGVTFKVFSEQRIRGTIIDELRAQDWLSRSLREKFKLLEHEFSALEQKLGRDPSSEEVATAMGISQEDYFQLLDDVHYLSVISLHDTWEDDSGSPFGLLDILEDESAEDPHVRFAEQQTTEILSAAIKELPEKEREIISRYYYDDRSLKEIGASLQLHESRVSQLHGQAILRLRVKMKGFQ